MRFLLLAVALLCPGCGPQAITACENNETCRPALELLGEPIPKQKKEER
jgi:hypothetical protein